MSAFLAMEERNSYLALREAKIARNHARLQELGLTSGSNNLRKRGGTESSDTAVVQVAKKIKSVTMEMVEPKRRSLRMKKIDRDTHSERKPVAIVPRIKVSVSDSDTVQRKPTVFAKNSARALHLDVERLLFGIPIENGTSGLLGVKLETTGKAFVIEESSRRAVHIEYTTPISFNKYCGAQEWGNAIYLWINFDAPGSEVVNTFFDKGKQVNWFGGSRMHDGTPLIQRLKRFGDKRAEQTKQLSDETVILWCRKYNAANKGFDPYICFGRLSVRLILLRDIHL
jgi:hypothetical protein